MTDNRPSVLLYDWDNTLVDGWAGITAALNAAFTAFGHTLWTVEDTRNRVRVSLRESFPVMFGDQWEHARDIFYADPDRSASGSCQPHARRAGCAGSGRRVAARRGFQQGGRLSAAGGDPSGLEPVFRFGRSAPAMPPPTSPIRPPFISHWHSSAGPPIRRSGTWATRRWTCRPLAPPASPRC